MEAARRRDKFGLSLFFLQPLSLEEGPATKITWAFVDRDCEQGGILFMGGGDRLNLPMHVGELRFMYVFVLFF